MDKLQLKWITYAESKRSTPAAIPCKISSARSNQRYIKIKFCLWRESIQSKNLCIHQRVEAQQDYLNGNPITNLFIGQPASYQAYYLTSQVEFYSLWLTNHAYLIDLSDGFTNHINSNHIDSSFMHVTTLILLNKKGLQKGLSGGTENSNYNYTKDHTVYTTK